MTRFWYAALALALALLAGSAFWWWAGRNAWEPPAPLMPEIPRKENLPPQHQGKAEQALLHPLFWVARAPIPPEAIASDAEQTTELSQSKLLAVLAVGDAQIAILRQPDGSELKISNQAGQQAAWSLSGFDGRKAVFTAADGATAELALDDPRPPAAGAPQRMPVAAQQPAARTPGPLPRTAAAQPRALAAPQQPVRQHPPAQPVATPSPAQQPPANQASADAGAPPVPPAAAQPANPGPAEGNE
ncbi:MAG: hypothetical protein LBP52_10445 [Burkholderiaceae bacterium]|jgi:hypothetical protein|nr:hypothetical protein [Burkholderiaceae bacterium]